MSKYLLSIHLSTWPIIHIYPVRYPSTHLIIYQLSIHQSYVQAFIISPTIYIPVYQHLSNHSFST